MGVYKIQRIKETMKIRNVWPWFMRKIRTSPSRSTKEPTVSGGSSNPDARSSTRSLPANLYTHCNETPLDVFIDALVNNNYNRLVKYGETSKEYQQQAWSYLFCEYCDLSGSKSYKQLYTVNREIGVLHSRLLAVQLCLYVLRINPEPQCVLLLKKMGYTCQFNPDDKDQYQEDLKAITKKSKTIEIALKEKQHELEVLKAEYGGKDATEDDFIKALVELSSFMGYRINQKEITVSEYLAIRQKYEREAKIIEQQKSKLRR